MVDFYHGVPGSGKSLYAAHQIIEAIDLGKYVVTNIPVNFKKQSWSPWRARRIKRRKRVHYLPNEALNADALVQLSRDLLGERPSKEGQILLVIDECETVFNSRDWAKSGRDKWTTFFSLHRKLGYDCILIAPSFEMADKQVRECAEVLTEFRCFSKFIPILGAVLPSMFIGISRYKGQMKTKANILKRVFFRYHRSWGAIYDTFAVFGALD